MSAGQDSEDAEGAEGADPDIAAIAAAAAAHVTATGDPTWIAVGKPGEDVVTCTELPAPGAGKYVDELARELKHGNLAIADVWLQSRDSAAARVTCANGITNRVRRSVDGDVCAADAALPAPTCWWVNADETVLAYMFTETVELWLAIAITEEFSIAIEGAELSYKAGGAWCQLVAGVRVHHSGPLFDVVAHAPALPRRILEPVRERCFGAGDPDVDVVGLLPATWGGVEVLRHPVHEMSDASNPLFLPMLTRVWLRAKGYAEMLPKLRKLPQGEQCLDRLDLPKYAMLCLARIYGGDEAGAFNLYFDDVTHDVRLLEGDRTIALKIKSETLFNKSHDHEFAATLARMIVASPEKDKNTGRWTVEVTPAAHPTKKSLGNKLLIGHTGTLRALGLPRIVRHEFAAAFVDDKWSVDSATRVVSAVRAARMLPTTDENFDTVEYFVGLHKAGRIPLATENDVRRFVMALASPLLRHVAPGLLGIYWMLGPPGSGKDFLAELLPDIHRHAVTGVASAKFTISLTNELEDKRQFYAAGPAIYARAKEAGKRAAMAEQLIRLAGTDQLPARGMRENEIAIANGFTYIAESAEEPPHRIEISRRTVEIHVLHVDDSVSLGQVRQEILAQAPNIVADLRRRVETKPAGWYLNQTQTKSRPVVPVALAQLFGVTLDEVEGRNLDDLFEAMHLYTGNIIHCGTEGEDQRKLMLTRKAKEPREAWKLKSHRFSHFVETMQKIPGTQALFSELRTGKAIELIIQREIKKYRDVLRGKNKFLPVKIHGRDYAFKMVRNNRNFILADLVVYNNAMNAVGGDDDADADDASDAAPVAASGTSTTS